MPDTAQAAVRSGKLFSLVRRGWVRVRHSHYSKKAPLYPQALYDVITAFAVKKC
jgi:hypothetical protein